MCVCKRLLDQNWSCERREDVITLSTLSNRLALSCDTVSCATPVIVRTPKYVVVWGRVNRLSLRVMRWTRSGALARPGRVLGIRAH